MRTPRELVELLVDHIYAGLALRTGCPLGVAMSPVASALIRALFVLSVCIAVAGCEPGAPCLESCETSDDCADGLVCSLEDQCIPDECTGCPGACRFTYDPDLLSCEYTGCE